MPPEKAQDQAEFRQRLRRSRHEFQKGMLKWLGSDPAGITQMKAALAALELSHGPGGASAFWQNSLALLEALAKGDIAVDGAIKRLCARIDGELRNLQEGSPKVAEPLMHDLLEHLARSRRRAHQFVHLAPGGGTILTKTLYDIYIAEAGDHLDTLEREIRPGLKLPPTAEVCLAADSLGGISDTIGQRPIKDLAFALGHALARMSRLAATPDDAGQALLGQVLQALREMTADIAAQRQPEAKAPLIAALDAEGQTPPPRTGNGPGRLDPSQAG